MTHYLLWAKSSRLYGIQRGILHLVSRKRPQSQLNIHVKRGKVVLLDVHDSRRSIMV